MLGFFKQARKPAHTLNARKSASRSQPERRMPVSKDRRTASVASSKTADTSIIEDSAKMLSLMGGREFAPDLPDFNPYDTGQMNAAREWSRVHKRS